MIYMYQEQQLEAGRVGREALIDLYRPSLPPYSSFLEEIRVEMNNGVH